MTATIDSMMWTRKDFDIVMYLCLYTCGYVGSNIMDIGMILWNWLPVLVLVLFLVASYFIWGNWNAILMYRYSRHQPWYNEIQDVTNLLTRTFDTQIGVVFIWEDTKRKRSVVLEWPPGGHATLIYRWQTENGISEMMRYSEDPGVESIYIPELYTGGALPYRARKVMFYALKDLKKQLHRFQYVHAA